MKSVKVHVQGDNDIDLIGACPEAAGVELKLSALNLELLTYMVFFSLLCL